MKDKAATNPKQLKFLTPSNPLPVLHLSRHRELAPDILSRHHRILHQTVGCFDSYHHTQFGAEPNCLFPEGIERGLVLPSRRADDSPNSTTPRRREACFSGGLVQMVRGTAMPREAVGFCVHAPKDQPSLRTHHLRDRGAPTPSDTSNLKEK